MPSMGEARESVLTEVVGWGLRSSRPLTLRKVCNTTTFCNILRQQTQENRAARDGEYYLNVVAVCSEESLLLQGRERCVMCLCSASSTLVAVGQKTRITWISLSLCASQAKAC